MMLIKQIFRTGKFIKVCGTADIQKYSLIEKRSLQRSCRNAGYEQGSRLLLDQKRQFLLLRFRKKLLLLSRLFRRKMLCIHFRENVLHVYPPSEDILPLVKERLGSVVYLSR